MAALFLVNNPLGVLTIVSFGVIAVILILVTTWGLAMVLPSFYRLAWPLASFGMTVDNDGFVVDIVGPFDDQMGRSPAEAAGLVIGDRLDLKQMNCWNPRSIICASLITVLGGTGDCRLLCQGD